MCSVSDSFTTDPCAIAPSTSPSDLESPAEPSDLGETPGDRDLWDHFLSLPTNTDLERFAHRVEKAL